MARSASGDLDSRASADSAEIPHDDIKRPGSPAGRILLLDTYACLHQTLFRGHKRYDTSTTDVDLHLAEL
jgi:hypothetical protein